MKREKRPYTIAMWGAVIGISLFLWAFIISYVMVLFKMYDATMTREFVIFLSILGVISIVVGVVVDRRSEYVSDEEDYKRNTKSSKPSQPY